MTVSALKWRHGSVGLSRQVVRQSEGRGAAGGDGPASSPLQWQALTPPLSNCCETTPILLDSRYFLHLPPRVPLSVAPKYIFLNFRLSNPSAPLETYWDVIMRTPRQRWLVSCVLHRAEHLPPSFFWTRIYLQQCRRRCAVIPATMMQTTCLVLSLRVLQLCFSTRGEMKGKGKLWGYLFWLPAHLAACTRVPLSF